MTSIVLAVLILTPAPIAPKEPPPWPTSPQHAGTAAIEVLTSSWWTEARAAGESLYAAIENSVQFDAPPVPPPETHPSDAVLAALRMCESTNRYDVNTGNGYWGAYQFDLSTWNGVASRYAPHLVGVKPHLAAPADQDAMARWLWQERGPQPWPVCGYRAAR